MLKSPESWFYAAEDSVGVLYRDTAPDQAVMPYSNLKTLESVKVHAQNLNLQFDLSVLALY